MNLHLDRQADTRTGLLEAADQLFLEHGYAGVSVRQITRASGANVAAVNYYFGDKTGLFREVLHRHLDRITTAKVVLLQQVTGQTPPARVEELLRAYIRSFFDSHLSAPSSDRLMQIIYREMGPDAVAADLVANSLIVPINRAFRDALLQLRPDLNPGHVSFCASSITGQILHFIRTRDILQQIRGVDQQHDFIEDVIEHITQFSLHGLGSTQHE